MFGAVRKLFQRPTAPQGVEVPSAAAPDWRKQGNEALARGDLEAAANLYRQGTTLPPGSAIAWLNLGYTQLELLQREAARESLRQAESLLAATAPELPDVWALMGRERQECGDWAGAETAYRRVVERVPTHELVWRELGQVCEKQRRYEDAQLAYTRAVALRGDFELAVRDLARLLLRLERDEEALPLIERCLASPQPDPADHVLHAHALWRSGRLVDGLAAADRGVAAGAGEPALHMRGILLTTLGRAEEGLACQAEVLARNPKSVLALVDSARALMRLGRFDEALARLDRALEIEPGRRDALSNKAIIFVEQLRCHEALALVENELGGGADTPDAAFLAGVVHLQLGDLKRGFEGYEARWGLWRNGAVRRKPRFAVPEWSGEPLENRSILLYVEQGLGDTLQFLRFVPEVARRAGRVWLEVQSPIWPVLPELPPNVELVRPDQRREINYVLSILSLPRVLGTTMETLPNKVPYLRVPPDRRAYWQQRLGPRKAMRVGMVWSGNPDQNNDHHRSIALERFLPLVPSGVEFFSLQKVVREGDRDALASFPGGISHFGEELANFGDTAALAAEMDLVISVCTSVAHLAGGLGLPTAVLLCHSPDWRWLLEREDSPWYPTARLFRQPRTGDWETVIEQVMAYVAERAKALEARR
jgi:tetratricopeptide (TPR) repeat protein